jgi:kinesin family protein 26
VLINDGILHSVVNNGTDACIFSYGQSKEHKHDTMFRKTSGIVPTALDWLFKLIEFTKLRSGTRFSVRLSALEIHGKEERIKDLLESIKIILIS